MGGIIAIVLFLVLMGLMSNKSPSERNKDDGHRKQERMDALQDDIDIIQMEKQLAKEKRDLERINHGTYTSNEPNISDDAQRRDGSN